jgi:hypothetical protein
MQRRYDSIVWGNSDTAPSQVPAPPVAVLFCAYRKAKPVERQQRWENTLGRPRDRLHIIE